MTAVYSKKDCGGSVQGEVKASCSSELRLLLEALFEFVGMYESSFCIQTAV